MQLHIYWQHMSINVYKLVREFCSFVQIVVQMAPKRNIQFFPIAGFFAILAMEGLTLALDITNGSQHLGNIADQFSI